MLREESITAVSHAPTTLASLNCDLLAGTERLIEEIQQRLLDGQSINNRRLTEIADRAYGGTRARGTYTARDAYDATETAVNKLLETQASEFGMGCTCAQLLTFDRCCDSGVDIWQALAVDAKSKRSLGTTKGRLETQVGAVLGQLDAMKQHARVVEETLSETRRIVAQNERAINAAEGER